ncbi:MAG: InlB B-repeat-containing protein [Peptoniphilus sp.]|uniref:InlB B-repeat-containing protein n=1 Tax=Peptoniphilus sp. TaxID=1971214 RepID=UPI00399FB89B
MKNYLKRTTTFFLAILMLVSVPLQAFAEASGNSKVIRKEDYINKVNKLPVKVKKTDNAEKLVKNPEKDKLYTVHADFKVQRGDDQIVAYQPYIATAGENISEEEKAKINKLVKFPVLDGYTSATKDGEATIDYKFIKKRALSHDNLVGDEYKGNFNYLYTPKSSTVKVKHVFQDINDFNKYGRKPGDTEDRIDEQKGLTGTSLTIQPLPKSETVGYVPESANINTQVPEHPDYFVVEYRYNLAHYAVNYNTDGGTPLPTRTAFYKQTIPSINEKDIPTKEGGEFQGWKPSVDIDGTGKTFKAGEVMKDASRKPILDLNANLIMPASNVTFTAVWKDKEKADYAVQFWTEKADHSDNASILDKYEYMGTRVYKDADTGSRPNLDAEPAKGLKFPDLDQARLNKIWAGARFNRGHDLFLNKFFIYNKELTDKENEDPKQPAMTKSVSATGKTVYNIYYDRQVYDLYFTKSNAQPKENTIYPEIWGYDPAKGKAVMKGGPGNLYHYKARFNEIMYKWPNDAKQTKGFTPGYQSFGWGPNYTSPNWPVHLDTPPYRLNANEFLDMANYTNWGGYTKHIDKGDGTTMDLDPTDFRTLSFGIKQDHPSIPHHMDFWMDGFKKDETIIRYDLVRTKADTAGLGYGHRYPIVTGFTPYGYNPRSAWPTISEGSQENGRVDEDRIGELNDERDDITLNTCGTYYNNNGIKLPIGQLDFIPHFFSDSDDFGDVKEGGQEFTENGYLQFHYKRNKYPLRFNYDPSKIKDDSEFNNTNQLETFYEFPLKVLSPDVDKDEEYKKVAEGKNPKNLLDDANNLYKLGLYDLLQRDKDNPNKFFQDAKGNFRVKRPEGLSDQMVFKGWALDPAGKKLIWENPKEKMPFHPVNLYAKWGEPDYKWKVTFDPDGGTLNSIDKENLTTELKNIKEGDVGQEVETTYPIKEAKDGDKQIFTVVQRQKLVEPKKPKKEGYDFMGWEIIRYKKDEKGDYTNEVDNSYRDTYKVPELYSFGNEVVGPIYLKAIWVESNLVDVESHHHFLDENYEEIKQDIQPLKDRRVGSYIAAVGSRQNAERLLVPKDEWDKLEENNTTKLKDSLTYAEYKKLDSENPRVNSYNQQIRVEPEKIPDPNDSSKLIDNPDAKLNQFHFYYRPFRHREYKINYLDERGRKEVEKFINESKKAFKIIKDNKTLDDAGKVAAYKDLLDKNKEAFKTIREKYAIIDQELVKNGKRDFDARNYRTIEGWVLDDKTQQQLFFDINDDSSAFYGINETGLDEINFFYKDVRVIETKKDDPVPDGYVRITFKAADGGSFTDKDNNAVKELYYDVIKGLKSDNIPVPQELKAGETKADDKYYITPDNGKKFIKWDNQKLLNDNTIIEKDYTFTAQYDWSDVHAKSKGLVKTEAFNDPNSTWTNNFAPTIDELKAQIVKIDASGNEVALPSDANVTIVDDEGNELTQNSIYERVKEKSELDTNELVRTVVFKAKVKFTGNEAEKIVDIPVKIYKNVYEALTNGDMPKVLKDATAPGGDLADVTGKYVKVTVNPTNKPTNKDAKIYYVNPKAWVNIAQVDISDDASNLGFTKWTADKTKQNETSGEFDFTKRHIFTEDTVITPNFSDDVIEQTDPNKKPDVPSNFVKVIVDKTDKADLKTGEVQSQTFWVNPTKEVIIPVTNPTGKIVPKSSTNPKQVAWMFEKWTSDKALGPWKDAITAKFTEETKITANYKQAENIIPYDPEEPKERPTGYVRVKFDADEGLTLKNAQYYYVKKNAGVTLKDLRHPEYEENTGYKFINWDKDDKTEIVDQDIIVTAKAEKLDSKVPDDGKHEKPAGYLEVVFVIRNEDQSKGSLKGVTKFFVKPNDYVKINPPETKANTGYEFGAWDKDTTIPTVYEENTTIEASFNQLDAVSFEKKPGYVKVEFTIDGEGGLIVAGQTSIYYVDPNRAVTLNPPTTKADIGYEFDKWDQDTRQETKYETETTIRGKFKKLDDIIDGENAKPEGYVTVRFDKGDHGSSISGKTIFYVNPEAKKTIGDISPKPTVTPDIGYTVKGWDKEDNFQIRQDITVNANYDNFAEVIPEKDDQGNKNTIPEGYVKVTFDTNGKGTIKGSTETQKNVFVKPNTAVLLKGYEPEIEATTEFEFSGWNIDLTKKTVYENGTVIKALYNDKGDISKTAIPGYVKVEFRAGSKGKLVNDKGGFVDITKLWVVPGKELTLPDPTVIPNSGHTFTGWDNSLTVNLPENSNTYVITAQYDDEENIIPKTKGDDSEKPKGYVKVTFRADDNGKLEGAKDVITYFVNPNAGIKLVELEDGQTATATQLVVPKTIADENYKFEKWYESLDTANPIMTDQEYVARFKSAKVTLTYNAGEGTGTVPESITVDYGTKVRLAPATGLTKADAKFAGWMIDGRVYQVGEEVELRKDTSAIAQWTTDEDIISYDPKEPITRPDTSYVRVTFEADNGLTLTEQKAYYVKKNAGKTIGELTKPGYTEETGYKFDKWDLPDSTKITQNITVKALATKLDTVIPEKDSNNQANQKPDGYKEVTFVIKSGDESKGSLEGNKKFYVNPNEYVTISPPKTNANTGFEFGAWSPDPSIPTVYKEDKTIEASFNGLKDVVPKTKTDDSEKPAGYVRVTFEIEGKGGSIVDGETTVYFVKPNTEVTINPPKTIAETGYNFEHWDASTTNVSFAEDKTIKGSFTKLKDIIDGNEAKPDGYVTLTFEKGEHGSLTGQTVYYVNPKANPAVKLGNEKLKKPEVKAEVGYKFTAWDTKDDFEIKDNKTVIAQYEPIDDVILKTKENESEKPDGYITVTFDTVDSGKGIIGSTIITKKVLFVNPNKSIILKDYAPTVNTKTGYKFARWDVSIDKAIQYKNGDVIHALYNDPGDISTTEVAGYVKVEFKAGANGSLSGTTEYWIKPGAQVNIPEPSVKPDIGYKFNKWDRPLTLTAQAKDPNHVITATYEELKDIIPQVNTDGSDKPAGYVTVTFEGVHGTLEGKTVYYVQKDKDVWLLGDGFADNLVKDENADVGYTSYGGKWRNKTTNTVINNSTLHLSGDTTITFTFKERPDVIEKTKDDQVAPKGYVTVKLFPTDKATEETKAEKIYFVNPTKEVTITNKPEGKKETINNIEYTYTFKGWSVTRGTKASWTDENIKSKFIQDTEITAHYSTNVDIGKLIATPIPKKDAVTPIKEEPKPEDLIENKTGLPDGTTFRYTDDGKPNIDKTGKVTAKVEVKYPNGKTVVVEVPITVVDNVVPQTGNDKPLVPESYVKVTVDTTDKATANTKFVKVFWVKPDVEVKIPDILAPTGKVVEEDGVKKTNKFIKWISDDDNKEYANTIKDTFTKDTKITATYEQDKNVEPKAKDNQWIPQGSSPSPKDFINNPYNDSDPNNKDNLPPGTKLEFVPGTEPNTTEPGTNKTTSIKITYPNGEVKEVPVTYNVTGDVVEQPDPNDPTTKPAVPDNFVKVIVKTTEKATEEVTRLFWVNPEKVVTIKVSEPTGKEVRKPDGTIECTWEFTGWDDNLTQQFKDKETIIKAKYVVKAPQVVPQPNAKYVITDVDVQPTKDMYLEKITPPLGKEIGDIEIVNKPDVSKRGVSFATIKVTYKDGTSVTVRIDVIVQNKNMPPTPEPEYPGGPDYPSYPGGPIPMYPEVRYETIIQEKIVKVPVPVADGYFKEVRYMQGFNGYFRPNDGLTRAEAAQILANALVEDGYKYNPNFKISYKDVGEAWYTRAVKIVTEAKVFAGYDDGNFKPQAKITRNEWIATLKRFQELGDASGNNMKLSDNHWAKAEIQAAFNEGWLKIYTDGLATYKGDEFIPRQEVAAVSNKAFKRIVDKAYIGKNNLGLITYKDVNTSMWAYEDILCASNTFLDRKDRYIAHWYKEDKNQFNIDTSSFDIVQKNFQRNPR